MEKGLFVTDKALFVSEKGLSILVTKTTTYFQ